MNVCGCSRRRQIKHVLKMDPEAALKTGNPGPEVELAFWKSKVRTEPPTDRVCAPCPCPKGDRETETRRNTDKRQRE